ncbi:MAG TPA: hypothetical protein DDY58_19560 [Terrisporobacter glycolicus]|uniref:hypothetical protein n=1 Tax=Terrisporobacter sp. TaxID=1965305 RepID=UPI000E87AC93|nr:hypothetical protein [Terrisporobacter sp.]HBI94444.1 hypothetical protein [Terrisporobacter hibernicus]
MHKTKPINLTISKKDNYLSLRRVKEVLYKLNGSKWKNKVSLKVGANSIQVKTIDNAGNKIIQYIF